MYWTERRERFRAVISGDRCVHPGSVYDPISARMAEDIGFEIGMFAGSVASMTVLGAPDHIVLTLSEFADQAYRICRAGNLALMVDADHGYGNAMNVKRTVEELETAGVSGLSIEDTELPQPYGKLGEPSLISIDEGVGKMKAALAGRQDSNLVIAGRTSAVGINGVDDAIARGRAYQDAGVDAMFFVGIKTREQLEAISAAMNIPIIMGGGGAELTDLDYLSAQGVRICLQSHQPFLASVRAAYETLKALRDGVPPKDITSAASSDLINQGTRGDDYDKWMKDFLGGA
jgi:carboxyvinyl-carboxyphosphonate phosphorylmutase